MYVCKCYINLLTFCGYLEYDILRVLNLADSQFNSPLPATKDKLNKTCVWEEIAFIGRCTNNLQVMYTLEDLLGCTTCFFSSEVTFNEKNCHEI